MMVCVVVKPFADVFLSHKNCLFVVLNREKGSFYDNTSTVSLWLRSFFFNFGIHMLLYNLKNL